MPFGIKAQRRAEALGFRLGRAIGKRLAETTSVAGLREHGRSAPVSAMPRRPTQSFREERHTRYRGWAVGSVVGPLNTFSGARSKVLDPVAAVLGVGVDLPVTRPLLRGALGVLQAELLLAGLGVASLVSFGNPSDPLHLTSGLLGLTSPLLQIALQPLLGPILADLILAGAAIWLMARVRSSRHRGRDDRAPHASSIAPPALSTTWHDRPSRLTAAG